MHTESAAGSSSSGGEEEEEEEGEEESTEDEGMEEQPGEGDGEAVCGRRGGRNKGRGRGVGGVLASLMALPSPPASPRRGHGRRAKPAASIGKAGKGKQGTGVRTEQKRGKGASGGGVGGVSKLAQFYASWNSEFGYMDDESDDAEYGLGPRAYVKRLAFSVRVLHVIAYPFTRLLLG